MLDVNGATLYFELRGQGPPVLFISGATGDAGHWTPVARALANEFTVITYDRRANSRSPRPAGWTATSADEQADDAAGLLRLLDLAPAVVFGTSAGANILSNIVLRHPGVARGAIFHEPAYPPVSSNPDAVLAGRAALIKAGLAKGGPPAAMELFLRAVGGDEAFASLDAQLRERLLGNGDVFFGVEMDALLGYLPAAEPLARVELPCVITAGAGNRDPAAAGHWRYEAAQWLAAQFGTTLIELSGTHMPYLARPTVFAEELRPLLRLDRK